MPMKLFLLVLVSLMPVSASAAMYYVDTGRGNDANDGKALGSAWQAIDKANSSLMPGDTCLIRGGVYANSQIAPARSGTAKARITYAAYPGETAEITGGKWGSIISLQDRSYVTVRGLKIHSPTEHDWVVRISGEQAHHNRIENCEITDPEGYAPVVLALKASYNTVVGCTIHDTGHGEEGSGDCIVLNEGAHHNTIARNKCFNACHSQIMAINGSTHNTISDNDLYSTKRAWAGAGVNLALGAGSNVVSGNRIHDLGYITDEKCAIQITSGDNVVRNNVIYHVGAFGVSLQSYRYGGTRQEAANNLVANNTIYDSGRQGLSIISKADCVSRGNRVVNNIVVGSPRDWYGVSAWVMVFDTYHLDKPAAPGEWFGSVFEGNLFFHAKPGEKDMVLYNHRGTPVTWSVPQLEAAYPAAFRHNQEDDPQFAGAARGDFRLKPSSPARGAGAALRQVQARPGLRPRGRPIGPGGASPKRSRGAAPPR